MVKLNYYSPREYDLKGGWGVKKGNIFFPIDPEHAMFVQIGERPVQKYSRLSEIKTKELIKMVTENAHSKIFSHCKDKNLPLLRQRVVDRDKFDRERKSFNDWHKINASMEREYIASNRDR